MRSTSPGSKPLTEKELEKINPQIYSNLSKMNFRARYLHGMNLCGWNQKDINEEDVERVYNSILRGKSRGIERNGTIIPTPHGCLEIDVTAAVKDLSKEGFTRSGRKQVKEKITLSLFHDFALYWYPEIGQYLLKDFTVEENEKIRQGTIHRLTSYEQDIHPIYYDKYIFDFYDFTKWEKCFKDRFDCTVETMDKAFCEIYRKYIEIEKKICLHEKEIEGTQKQKERRMAHISVLSYIYAVRYIEEKTRVNFFKSNEELLKIWNIPRATFYDKMKYLRSIDNRFSD